MSELSGNSINKIKAEIYNFQMWESIVLTSYYKLCYPYGFEPTSVEHWGCLEAIDLQTGCWLLVMQHLGNTTWDTAQTLAMILLYHYELPGLKIFNVFQSTAVILSDAQIVHILASGSQFQLAPESFWYNPSS